MMIWIAPALAASVTLNPGDDVATLTASMTAGDEIVFNAGSYSLASPLTWTGQGTEAAPIRLVASGEVTLELQTGWTVVYLSDVAWMEIEGLHFRGADGISDGHYGLYVENAEHLSIRDCEVGPTTGTGIAGTGILDHISVSHTEVHDSENGYGMYWGCDDAQCWLESSTLSNNWIHDIGGDYNYALYVAAGGQDNSIVDNVLYNNLYRGLSVHSTEYGPYNEVRGNAIWSVGDIGLYVRGAARVWNNLVFEVDGIGIYATTNDHDILDDVVISHNTVWGTSDWGAYIEHWAGRSGNVFANNAISNVNGYGLGVADGGVDEAVNFSNNVVSGLVEGVDVSSAGGPVLAGRGDADFVDPLGWNFYPSSSSALLGKGDPAGSVPTDDFNGVSRNAGAPDVGAYERVGEDNPGWVLQEGFKDSSEVSVDDGAAVGGCCGDDGAGEEALLLAPLGLFWGRRRGAGRRGEGA